MNWLRSKKTIAVHSGNFHPDDVFSVALFSILFDGNIKVIRTRDEGEITRAEYVADVGHIYDPAKKRFDHHQEGGAGFRDNHISYSAFGLLWKEYGEKVCGSKRVADIIDKKIVEAIDADDDGIDICKENIPGLSAPLLVDVIYSMRPTWNEAHLDIDKVFLTAVDFAKGFLLRQIKIAQDDIEAEGMIDEIYNNSKDKRVIIFDKEYLPKNILYKYPEPLFIVYFGRDRLMWRVTTIEKNKNTYEPRKNFPESWWGKKGEEFAKVSGVEDALFCRNKGIFAGVKSKDGALKLVEPALQEVEKLNK